MLAACGAAALPVRRPSELAQVDALVIPGGESTTIGKLAVECGLLEPVQERIRSGMPTFGSCAGMVMLADDVLDGRPDQVSFGGIDMTVRRNAFGRQVDSFEGDVDMTDIGDFPGIFIRAPWVERVGPGVRVLGRVGGIAPTAKIVAVRQRQLLATAFHPELTGDLRVHRLFVEMAREAGGTEG